MERGLQSNLGIVQTSGVEFDLGAIGAAAEEVDRAAFADHVDRPFPCLGTSDSFNDYIAATLLR